MARWGTCPLIPVTVDSGNGEGDRHSFWGVMPLDPSSSATVPVRRSLLVSGQEIGLSASGLLTCQFPDGGLRPDSWIRLGETLQLGRDPFGRVPLYWMDDAIAQQKGGQLVWFSTQFRALTSLLKGSSSTNSSSINLEGFYGYAGCSYVPTPHTPITGIYAVPAATELTWDSSHSHESQSQHFPRQHTYWQWRQSPEQMVDEEKAIAQLQHLLLAAVERQLASIPGGRVGVFLSGGLDSSIVAALLVRAGVDVCAYSLDFGDEALSEIPYAQQVAAALGIPLKVINVTPAEVKRAIAPTAKALGMPFGDGVTVPLYLLNQVAAADGIQVVFNGENGDQLFAGWTNKPLIAAGIYSTVSGTSHTDLSQQYLKTFHRLYGYESQAIAPIRLSDIQSLNPHTWLSDSLDDAHCQTFLHKMRRATLMLKGAQNIQPRATALAWAHGLQVRSPFCDLPLATWSFRLSGALQLQGNCEKYILKRAVEPWLPPDIIWRDKRGMGVPLTPWCLQHFWHDLGHWLNPAILRAEGLWHPHLPKRIVSYQLGGIQGRRIGEILWLMVMWQMWRHHVLGDRCPLPTPDHPFWLPHPLWDFIRKETHQ